MQNVDSENFYKSVIYDLEKALADGYVIYYEAVQTRTPDSKAFFERLSGALTGSSDRSGIYKAMGEACGPKFRSDYFTLLDADKQEHPEADQRCASSMMYSYVLPTSSASIALPCSKSSHILGDIPGALLHKCAIPYQDVEINRFGKQFALDLDLFLFGHLRKPLRHR